MLRLQPFPNDEDLMHRLTNVFKDYGYEGASLSILSKATGLEKSSLYYRFPEGKKQMAEEVLTFTQSWIEENILEKLKEDISAEKKLALFSKQIGNIYDNGKDSCLLNMLSTTKYEDNPFAELINATFKSLKSALENIAMQAGVNKKQAKLRAETVLVEIQGALVLSRATGTCEPFKHMQRRLPEILLHS